MLFFIRTAMAVLACSLSVVAQQTAGATMASRQIAVSDAMVRLIVESQQQVGNEIEYTVRGERKNPSSGSAFATAAEATSALHFRRGQRLSANTVRVRAAADPDR